MIRFRDLPPEISGVIEHHVDEIYRGIHRENLHSVLFDIERQWTGIIGKIADIPLFEWESESGLRLGEEKMKTELSAECRKAMYDLRQLDKKIFKN